MNDVGAFYEIGAAASALSGDIRAWTPFTRHGRVRGGSRLDHKPSGMAVTALVTIPVNASTPGHEAALVAAFGSALGSSEIVVDALSAKVMLHFHFPGDIDPLMSELYRAGLSHSATLALSVRVDTARSGSAGRAEVLERLGALPAVSNPAFDGYNVSVTVAAATTAMRRLHDEIVSLGLVPVDSPAPKRA